MDSYELGRLKYICLRLKDDAGFSLFILAHIFSPSLGVEPNLQVCNVLVICHERLCFFTCLAKLNLKLSYVSSSLMFVIF
jgi:hypothetical protein